MHAFGGLTREARRQHHTFGPRRALRFIEQRRTFGDVLRRMLVPVCFSVALTQRCKLTGNHIICTAWDAEALPQLQPALRRQ